MATIRKWQNVILTMQSALGAALTISAITKASTSATNTLGKSSLWVKLNAYLFVVELLNCARICSDMRSDNPFHLFVGYKQANSLIGKSGIVTNYC